MYTGTSLLSQKSVWHGTWIAPTERSGPGGMSFRSLGLRGGLPRNSRKFVSAAYRIYWRLQQARSCWFLHCANVGTANRLAIKRNRSDEILTFMRASLAMRHTDAVSKDRTGGAQAAASA